MSSPEPTTLFETAAGATSAVRALPRAVAKAAAPRGLSSAALAVAAQRFKRPYSPIVVAGFVRVIEIGVVAVVGLTLYLWEVAPDAGSAHYYIGSIIGISLLSLLAFQAADIYQVQAFRGHEKQYMRLASAWSVVFLIAVTSSYFTQSGDQFSRVWLGSFYVVGLFALIAFRRALFLLVRRWTRQGRLDRRTVVVGADGSGEALIAALAAQRDTDVRVIGVFDDRGDGRSSTMCEGVPKLGTVDDLVEFARHTRVDLVIFALPVSAEGRILQMLKKLWVLPVDIRLAAHTNKLRFRPRSYSYIGQVPVLDIFDRPIADWDCH
jgi:FlaA1/EpsC-like NDP-sugar epimerase